MNQKVIASNNNIGFTGALFLVFLVLKLTGVIGWSWWWVTAPLWGPLALAGLIFAGYFVYLVISDWLKDRARKKRLEQR